MNENDIPKWKIEYIQKCWTIMETFLENGEYVCGNDITIADYCCIATISSIDKIAVVDSEKYPNLFAWMKRMKAIPFYESENAEGAADFQRSLLNTVEKRRSEVISKKPLT